MVLVEQMAEHSPESLGMRRLESWILVEHDALESLGTIQAGIFLAPREKGEQQEKDEGISGNTSKGE